ncbi:MAG: hypothetical protein DI587_36535 [Variovorax paradoxus]|nr:MAG: hypothetical protein DI583_36535 [Variovorax paradoxus]PZQ00759.1 MAG: hypothetical protein DI587_36535 [Variovorax paradoxus]
MKLQLTSNGVVVATATLDNHDSAHDLLGMLPLRLMLRDYAGTEKIADLPRALRADGMSAAYTPFAGDICFYAPWGNLAIFYRNGERSEGLVRIGRLDSGMDAIRCVGEETVMLGLRGATD